MSGSTSEPKFSVLQMYHFGYLDGPEQGVLDLMGLIHCNAGR